MRMWMGLLGRCPDCAARYIQQVEAGFGLAQEV